MYEATKKQLDEFRSRIPNETISEIEKALENLNEWKDKDLQTGDIETVKNVISETRNAAMKIGQAMNNQSAGSSEGQEQQQQQSENDGEKKN